MIRFLEQLGLDSVAAGAAYMVMWAANRSGKVKR